MIKDRHGLSEKQYRKAHEFIAKNFPKSGICEKCGAEAKEKSHDYASIGHTYTKEIFDWIELCAKCHRKLDFLMKCRENCGWEINNDAAEWIPPFKRLPIVNRVGPGYASAVERLALIEQYNAKYAFIEFE